MNKFILLGCFFAILTPGFSQTGLFKNLNVKTGLTVSYFHNFQGEYVYILKQDASVKEKSMNKDGATLSVVVLFPLGEEQRFNFLLNIPLIDYKSDSPDPKNDGFNFFNSQTPFGVGFAVFPFDGAKFFGFSSMVNFGRQKRMHREAVESQFFPIADHPGQDLYVGAPVPEKVLEPFMHKVTTVSLNAGIIIRL
ncbi:MAG: hypothetical protein J7621_02990 [Niastella sp.]|nr:hypothetical protein [Niastella sp.]